MSHKLVDIKQGHKKMKSIIDFHFGNAIRIGYYDKSILEKISDDIHNRMYFELLLKNFILAQRNALSFADFVTEQNKTSSNWHFIRIGRGPKTGMNFNDPYINVLAKCKNYADVFKLLLKALPDINLVLLEYVKLKKKLDSAEGEILYGVARNHITISNNHRKNLQVNSEEGFRFYREYEDGRKAADITTESLDFLFSYRLNHLITDHDLEVRLKKKNYAFRLRIKKLTELKLANEKRLKSLLKRRKTLRAGLSPNFKPRPHPAFDYPIEKLDGGFHLKPKKTKKKTNNETS